ncbi:MAG: ABC transporter permease subunit, partial [Alphaproteobacteria bacterium]
MFSLRTVRSLAVQALALAVFAALLWAAASTAAGNLADRGITSGFGFLTQPAGYDIAFTLVEYRLDDTHGRVFLVGMLNTLFVSALGIVLATGLGVLLGVLRLSGNILMAGLVTGYVEVLRNIPLPLQILFWYGLLQALPTVREGSLSIGGVVFLNNRGLELPRPDITGDLTAFGIGLGLAAVGTGLALLWAGPRRGARGRVPRRWPGLRRLRGAAPQGGGG